MNCCLHRASGPMNRVRCPAVAGRVEAGPHRCGLRVPPRSPPAAAGGGSRKGIGLALALTGLFLSSCGQKSPESAAEAGDPPLTTNGTVEVTARLVEIPEGAIFKRELYDYATILRYQVLKVHRGEVKADTIYVGHYDPWKPRREAADRRVKGIGGNVRQFEAGQVHRMALEVPIEDHFMGGIVNKYFGRATGPFYWAVWTNRAEE